MGGVWRESLGVRFRGVLMRDGVAIGLKKRVGRAETLLDHVLRSVEAEPRERERERENGRRPGEGGSRFSEDFGGGGKRRYEGLLAATTNGRLGAGSAVELGTPQHLPPLSPPNGSPREAAPFPTYNLGGPRWPVTSPQASPPADRANEGRSGPPSGGGAVPRASSPRAAAASSRCCECQTEED